MGESGIRDRAASSRRPAGDAGVCLKIDSVHHAYGRRAALAGVNLTLTGGEVLAVIGPSGAGKTTLLELACRLRRPSSGTVAGQPAALMAQRDMLLEQLSALDNAALALRFAGRRKRAARAQAQALFEELGIAGFEHALPGELSGGMRQRVAFIRTLLAERPVLCLDEPFAALDAITRAQAQRWLERALHARPRSVLMVTHDIEEALLLADRVAVLSARPGRLLEIVPVALQRPRSRTDAGLVALRRQLIESLAIGMQAGQA